MADRDPFAEQAAAYEATVRGGSRDGASAVADPFAEQAAQYAAETAPAETPAGTRVKREPKRAGRVIIRSVQKPTTFEPGPRTDGGTLIPSPLVEYPQAIADAPDALAASGTAGKVAVNAAKELPGLVGGAIRTFSMYDPAYAAAAPIGQGIANITEMTQQQPAMPPAKVVKPGPVAFEPDTIGSIGEAAGAVAEAFRGPPSLGAMVGGQLTDWQRKYVDQPGAPERGQPSVRGFFDAVNPPQPGELVGAERMADKPLSVLSDVLMAAGGAYGAAKGAKSPFPTRVEQGRINRQWAPEMRVERGLDRARIRSEAPPEPAITIERAAPEPSVPDAAEAAWEEAWKNYERPKPEASGWEESWAKKGELAARAKEARTTPWTANEIRDAQKVDFGTAQRIAAHRNKKIAEANRLAQVEPGVEAVVKVGEQTYRITKSHSLDPIIRREVNDAIAKAEGLDAPIEKPPPRPAPFGSATKLRRGVNLAPAERDVVTGNDYPIRFTESASDSPVTIERAARAERRAATKRALSQERGASVVPGAIVDAGMWTYNRTLDLIAESAKRGGNLVGRTAPLYEKAARSVAWAATRNLFDGVGDAIYSGANKGAAKALAELDANFPNAGAAAHKAQQLWRDTFHGVRAFVPKAYERAINRKTILETEPRTERIHRIITNLEKMDPGVLKALMWEKTFESLPQGDPVLSAMVRNAKPAFKEASDLFQELGIRKEWHGRITKHTREHGDSTYYPHRWAQAGRSTVQNGLAERGVLKTMAAKGRKREVGRTRSDLDFWMDEGQSKDLVWHVIDEVMRQHEQLDRLDVLGEMSHEPTFGVAKQPLVNEKNARVSQSAHVDNALIEIAKAAEDTAAAAGLDPTQTAIAVQSATKNATITDAMGLVNDKLDALRKQREAIDTDLGVNPQTKARWTNEVNRIDKKMVPIADSWELLASLKAEGIVTLADARAHVAKELAAVDAKIADFHNEVGRQSSASGINYISLEEAFKRAGRDPNAARDPNLGLMQGGYINADVVDSGAFDVLFPGTKSEVHRNIAAVGKMWQMGQTLYNRRSWFNNGMGASSLAALGRFPFKAQPTFVSKALGDLLGNPDAVRSARLNNLNLNGNLLRADVRAKLAKLSEGGVTPTALENIARIMRDARVVHGYRIIDDAFRLGMYDYGIRVRGMAPEAAAEWANHWVLDPSNKPSLLRKVEVPLGMALPPFMSITLQTLPRVIEGAMTNPTMFAALGTLGWTSSAVAKMFGAQDESDVERRTRLRGVKEQAETLAVPLRDDNGNPIESNMSSWNPVAGITNIAGRGGGGPLAIVADAITNAPSRETGLESPYPLRRALAEGFSPEAGRALDVIDAATPSRGRIDENKEPISLGTAITKEILPVNYRGVSTDMLERQMAGRVRQKVKQLRYEFGKLAPEAQASKMDELERDITKAWADAGFMGGDPESAPPPSTIDRTRPFVIRARAR